MLFTVEIETLADLINQISELRNQCRTVLWFRGQRDATWNVVPSVCRDGHKSRERNYVHRFRSRAGTRYANLPNHNDWALWLGLMQHYGLPTRLLDWSRSPLVAAYFALETYIYEHDSESADAAIWVLQPHDLNLSECGEEITPSLEARMCLPLVRPAFFHRHKETNQVLAVMASEHDLRMFVQQGCFTVHSDPTPMDLRQTGHRYLSKFIIPARAVRTLAREIELCGFRRGDIYPDLGNLASELKTRHGI